MSVAAWTPACPLCACVDTEHYLRDHRRDYYQCSRCALVFVPPAQHPAPEREKAEYDLHRNAVDDPGYRAFLARLANPLLARLAPASDCLDFGCGPGPALAAMLGEAGHRVALYDPYYAPDRSVLKGHYDAITATEVVEHLRQPGAELEQLWRQLRPGGWLGVMTGLVRDRAAFARWRYKDDITHLCFFSDATWDHWLEGRDTTEVVREGNVLLVRRGRGANARAE